MKLQLTRNRFAALAVLGSITGAPFLALTPSALAAPPDHAPAWGYRNKGNKGKKPKKDKKDKNRDRDDRYDDRDDRDDDNRDNRNVTVFGTVVRDVRGSDRFEVLLDNGRTVQVISRDRDSRRISRGDRVELRGDFENNLFIADRVRIVDNDDSDLGRQTTLRGRVVRDLSGREFEIILDNGDRVRVRSLRSEPIRLSEGDRVTVQGRFENNVFIARDVDVVRNDDRRRVDFPGVVVSRVGSSRLLVRGDNGRIYTVTADFSLSRFDRDDRVRVIGFANGGIVSAESIESL